MFKEILLRAVLLSVGMTLTSIKIQCSEALNAESFQTKSYRSEMGSAHFSFKKQKAENV